MMHKYFNSALGLLLQVLCANQMCQRGFSCLHKQQNSLDLFPLFTLNQIHLIMDSAVMQKIL